MADTSVSATAIIDASAEVIFAILADPAKHAAIDGTGWVVESLGSQPSGSKVSIRSDAETGLPCHLCQTSTSNASLLYLTCTTSTPRLPATAG